MIPENTPENIVPQESAAERERRELQEEVLAELRNAANSEARVRSFAYLADTVGLDVLLSLLIPALGDAGASGLAGLYLLYEAKKAGLNKRSYLKIIGLQLADFAIGAIPIAGDVADYFFKASRWSEASFHRKTEQLVEKAREAGVPEEDLAKIKVSAEKLPQLVHNATALLPSKRKRIRGNRTPLKKVA